jgi:hypothetical protein
MSSITGTSTGPSGRTDGDFGWAAATTAPASIQREPVLGAWSIHESQVICYLKPCRSDFVHFS